MLTNRFKCPINSKSRSTASCCICAISRHTDCSAVRSRTDGRTKYITSLTSRSIISKIPKLQCNCMLKSGSFNYNTNYNFGIFQLKPPSLVETQTGASCVKKTNWCECVSYGLGVDVTQMRHLVLSSTSHETIIIQCTGVITITGHGPVIW